MSLINTQIKPFATTAYRNGAFIDVTSDDLAGTWNIIFFYPADFTFVCPTELSDLQSVYPELRELGVEVYSVSRDSHFVHKAWHETSPEVGTLEYAMLGDVSGVITENFDNMRPESGLADRSTFLIDPDGVIQYIETTPEGVGRNAADLLHKIKAAQYVRSHPNEVCPAKWEEGEDTLTPSFELSGKI